MSNKVTWRGLTLPIPAPDEEEEAIATLIRFCTLRGRTRMTGCSIITACGDCDTCLYDPSNHTFLLQYLDHLT